MSDIKQFEVSITAPMTVRVWAENEDEARKKAVMREGLLSVGFPTCIEVKEVGNGDTGTSTD